MNLTPILLLFIVVISTGQINAGVLYPYGTSLDTTNIKANDGVSDEIRLNIPLFGRYYSSIYVNNNGLLSFDMPINESKTQDIPIAGETFLAPFWADVDNSLSGDIYYRWSNDSDLLSLNENELKIYFSDIFYTPKWVLVATWDKVPCYNSSTDKVNTFQAVLSTDETNTFIMYNYGDIQWITGTNADGDLEGLSYDVPGRTPALAGGNSGQINSYFKIPASLTSSMMNITSTSNVDVPGRWVFKVDRMEVTYPNMTQSKCTLD
ncbi:alpha-tectorin-like [Engystomops pustulosus]|uniref:alpha-tectorin-like n=1 Tax=Engystomops pustulosus TaxID=76066 RepID=UPI003AFAF850